MAPAPEHPKHPYNHLQHTVSMANLHEMPVFFDRRSPSPTASSVSSATSRSTTPVPNNNPWFMASPSFNSNNSTNTSPRDSPNRTPQYNSRSTTPVAPQPMRPIPQSTGFVPMSPAMSSGEAFRGSEYPGSPVSNYPGSPNPYRQNQSQFTLPPLTNGFVTPVLLSQCQSGFFYELTRRQGWEPMSARRAFLWSLSNPRTSFLLYLCDDVASWRSAMFWDLKDENLPFSEPDLQRVVADPRKVVDMQWRVTAKELPLNGSHVEFTARETVPLQQLNLIRTSSPDKSTDRVRLLGDGDERILIRKRFVLTRPTQKTTLLEQINGFKRLDHRNIGKILCSYSQLSHIGIVTAPAQYTLDDYLCLPGEPNRSRILLDWMTDLAQALDYLHSQQISHRSIRPRKILIERSRIFLAPFGIGQNSDSFSPTLMNTQRPDQLNAYFQDQSYIFAAPEAIVPRGKKPGRPADVYALGCVFLCMMTVVQNISLSTFTQYRAGSSHDASFHANPERVGSWRARLSAASNSVRNGIINGGRRERQLKSEAFLLSVIEKMIAPDTNERFKMKKLTAYLTKWGDGKAIGIRRRSLDGGGYSGQIAAGLGVTNVNGNGTHVQSGINGGGGNGVSNSVGINGGQQKPELSVFGEYFQQQSRRYEQPNSVWGAH
ncbi:kinase-like domain-containing protein [Clohesyomyces aquaticus]|uniref:Kinase-like domain-containing protein n=1 Tax=Clohesyomyces aquaticus TaxID=1231657 RepID=A0A1Y2A7M3_9PLEO|nr:kinase-like domain-containing protein [Clohesyomyces aquaticus]